MISVIVPTMWKFAPFPDFLWDILEHPCVGQVILINNDHKHTPQHKIFTHAKILVLDFGQNIFVNPAWNAGAYYAKYPILCFINDDILFDLRIFARVLDKKDEYGMIGLFHHDKQIDCKDIIVIDRKDEFPNAIGMVFFILQKNWIDIPSELNVHYGDYFLWEVMGKSKPLLFIKNLLNWTPESQTSKFFTHMYGYESVVWCHTVEQYGLTGNLFLDC